ncbi:hypothetical protein H4Q26_013410 [Puccinia striiformis f. sp. tritici PST-130]|nr:hypothetical protein H4Q26_013410 [Puccinia striiformis f. sp. tritici PST-130]
MSRHDLNTIKEHKLLRSEGFNLELGVDKAFTNLQQLKKSFPDELLEKGFKLINDDLFNTFNDLPDLPIITELRKARDATNQ